MGQQQPGGLPEFETVPGHVEEEQGELFDDRLERAERGYSAKWTEADLQVLGERVRDYLRKVVGRAVAAFVVGGVEEGDAKLYVSEDLSQVARETWTAPKAAPGSFADLKERRRAREDSGGA